MSGPKGVPDRCKNCGERNHFVCETHDKPVDEALIECEKEHPNAGGWQPGYRCPFCGHFVITPSIWCIRCCAKLNVPKSRFIDSRVF